MRLSLNINGPNESGWGVTTGGVPMQRLHSLIAGVFLLLLAVGGAAAQSSLQGRVVDRNRAPVAGARVTVEPQQGTAVSTVTDQLGEFALALPMGPYTLRIAAARFAEVSQTLIAAPASEDQSREFVLELTEYRETINVEATAGYQAPAVLSATKTLTDLRDVPQSVSVVTAALIADQRMESMADVVRYMPGIGMAQGEGNRDTPIFRGNASTADFFVDGVRDDVQYFRDVYNVDRVEALKGPNGMIFGRGGVGGVINRVTRKADQGQSREIDLQLGSWDNRRVTADFGQGLTKDIAARVTGVYDDSDSFRDDAVLERFGANPTFLFDLTPKTSFRVGYEYFYDDRTADRGISSFQGRPVDTEPETFFGDPERSSADTTVNFLSTVVNHEVGAGATLRNRLSFGDYDKFYQNVFPGAVNAAGTQVSISAYNNASDRQNLFNQTDFTISRDTGKIGHSLLMGMELGRQETDNFRNTGFFTTLGPTVTTVLAPLSNPRVSLPLEFRQGATDADNHGVATVAALYIQDQVFLSEHFQAVLGLRYDSFNMDFTNNRTGVDFSSDDGLLSPRLGLIYKPVGAVSLYTSYSLSYLPRAGEQLSSLSLTNQALDPEEFTNYEVGAKWDLAPTMSFTAAFYRLERSNVAVPDPADPTRSLLVDAQRTNGLELQLSGNPTRRWGLVGGYAYQDGEVTRSISATAHEGATLAQLPEHSFSLWNKYDISSQWGAGLGLIHRAEIFTSTDNLVTLPSFTRVDGAVFYSFNARLRVQANVENLLDEEYYSSAHSNTNISPGSPRAARVAVTTRF